MAGAAGATAGGGGGKDNGPGGGLHPGHGGPGGGIKPRVASAFERDAADPVVETGGVGLR